MELLVQEYDLTLFSWSIAEDAPVQINSHDLAQFIDDPIVADDGERVVSVRDQLSLTIQPPMLTLTDHQGAAPARPKMVSAAAAVTEALVSRGIEHHSHVWNVDGSVEGVRAHETMRALVDQGRISPAFGDDSTSWSIAGIALTAEPTIAGRVFISLHISVEPDGRQTLGFRASAQSDGAPDVARLEEEAARIWRVTSE